MMVLFYLTSHSYDNTMKRIYKLQQTSAQHNSCSPEIATVCTNNGLQTIWIYTGHDFPSFCLTISPSRLGKSEEVHTVYYL